VGPAAEQGDECVAALQRWEESGAVWRVVATTSSRVTVALCRCDGGEEVERFSSGDPAVLAYLDGRLSSED
jgi:hypothetical protein